MSKKSMLNITEPVQAGIITDAQAMEMVKQIFEHQIFNNELKVSPEDHKIMITEPPNNPKKNREMMVDIM